MALRCDLASRWRSVSLENTMKPGMCPIVMLSTKQPDHLSPYPWERTEDLMQIDGSANVDTKTDSTFCGVYLIGIQTANILPILSSIRASLPGMR